MLIFFLFLYGVVIGSFLNVLIYRLPLNILLLSPKRSFCPSCNHQISILENIPIVSYIFLKGRCKNCKEAISVVYPIVEFLSGLGIVGLYMKFGLNGEFFLLSFIFFTLIVLSFIDFRYKAVPDYILVVLFLFSILYIVLFQPSYFINMLLFVGGFSLLNFLLTFYIQNIKSKILKDDSLKDQIALGEGDIPVVAAIGAILSIKLALLAIFLSAIFAMIPSIFNIVVKKDIQTPFIPFLSLGLYVSLIFGDMIYEII